MYKHIMLATDGSELAQHAVAHGLALAKQVGAKALVVTVTQPWSAVAYGEMAVAVPPEDFDKSMKLMADRTLSAAAKIAKQQGVPCQTEHLVELNPYQAILAKAQAAGVDLIVVGSHGRSGLSRLLLGSETVKVLTHAKIPVLVWRE
jgi:nucleotide-binding universal stress UspA family protein